MFWHITLNYWNWIFIIRIVIKKADWLSLLITILSDIFCNIQIWTLKLPLRKLMRRWYFFSFYWLITNISLLKEQICILICWCYGGSGEKTGCQILFSCIKSLWKLSLKKWGELKQIAWGSEVKALHKTIPACRLDNWLRFNSMNIKEWLWANRKTSLYQAPNLQGIWNNYIFHMLHK